MIDKDVNIYGNRLVSSLRISLIILQRMSHEKGVENLKTYLFHIFFSVHVHLPFHKKLSILTHIYSKCDTNILLSDTLGAIFLSSYRFIKFSKDNN